MGVQNLVTEKPQGEGKRGVREGLDKPFFPTIRAWGRPRLPRAEKEVKGGKRKWLRPKKGAEDTQTWTARTEGVVSQGLGGEGGSEQW